MLNLSTSPLFNNRAIAVTLLLLFDSFHLIFARLLVPYISPFVGGFYVLAFATLEVTIFMGWRGLIQWQVLRQHWRFFATIGLLVATATGLSYSAVRYIDAGTASLLSRMVTVFALAFSVFWLREKLSRKDIAGAVLAILGVIIINFQPSNFLQLGTLFVLGSTFCYALHAAVTKKYGDNINFANFFLFRVASTTFFLSILVTALGEWEFPTAQGWFILFLVGTLDVTVSRVFYYIALRRLKMSAHTILLTLSPVLVILWSLLFFAERPNVQSLMGGTVVIIGVIIMNLPGREQ